MVMGQRVMNRDVTEWRCDGQRCVTEWRCDGQSCDGAEV
jgi:hypothetical protein